MMASGKLNNAVRSKNAVKGSTARWEACLGLASREFADFRSHGVKGGVRMVTDLSGRRQDSQGSWVARLPKPLPHQGGGLMVSREFENAVKIDELALVFSIQGPAGRGPRGWPLGS